MGVIKPSLIFLALAPTGNGISGSDRIFIELAREWSKNIPLTIFTTIEGVEMMKRQQLEGNKLLVKKVSFTSLPSSFLIKYLYKVILGIRIGITLKLENIKGTKNILYSSSDFLMDVIPAILLKIRYINVFWVATWFQTAPNPLIGFREGKRSKSYLRSALPYWLSQLIVKPFINKFADLIIVNNEDERKVFRMKDSGGKVVVLIGAVRIDQILNYQRKFSNQSFKYDAVFQGRFHPQKGVEELVDIWEKVIRKYPKARLAMIGDGPLMESVKQKIKNQKLENNIHLLGFMFDGDSKYEVLARSKMVLHPAFFDSGGMASAEAMAFGAPCIGFNLESYKSYYPTGMVKVKIGDLDAFSEVVVDYLRDDQKREKEGKIAEDFVKSNWSWKNRSGELLLKIINQINKQA